MTRVSFVERERDIERRHKHEEMSWHDVRGDDALFDSHDIHM
jgi:hypothetical protein